MATEIATIEDLQNMKGELIKEFKKLLKEQFGYYLYTHERFPTTYFDPVKRGLKARAIGIGQQFINHPVLNPVADERDKQIAIKPLQWIIKRLIILNIITYAGLHWFPIGYNLKLDL